jgi:predicted negative regulator of RcsB-dependent stress response
MKEYPGSVERMTKDTPSEKKGFLRRCGSAIAAYFRNRKEICADNVMLDRMGWDRKDLGAYLPNTFKWAEDSPEDLPEAINILKRGLKREAFFVYSVGVVFIAKVSQDGGDISEAEETLRWIIDNENKVDPEENLNEHIIRSLAEHYLQTNNPEGIGRILKTGSEEAFEKLVFKYLIPDIKDREYSLKSVVPTLESMIDEGGEHQAIAAWALTWNHYVDYRVTKKELEKEGLEDSEKADSLAAKVVRLILYYKSSEGATQAMKELANDNTHAHGYFDISEYTKALEAVYKHSPNDKTREEAAQAVARHYLNEGRPDLFFNVLSVDDDEGIVTVGALEALKSYATDSHKELLSSDYPGSVEMFQALAERSIREKRPNVKEKLKEFIEICDNSIRQEVVNHIYGIIRSYFPAVPGQENNN